MLSAGCNIVVVLSDINPLWYSPWERTLVQSCKKKKLVQGFWAAQPHEHRYFEGIFLNTRQNSLRKRVARLVKKKLAKLVYQQHRLTVRSDWRRRTTTTEPPLTPRPAPRPGSRQANNSGSQATIAATPRTQ
jgi:hypothetical protein